MRLRLLSMRLLFWRPHPAARQQATGDARLNRGSSCNENLSGQGDAGRPGTMQCVCSAPFCGLPARWTRPVDRRL